jgi:hypothetical protein
MPLTLDQTDIDDIIMDATEARLLKYLETDISDDAKAGLVRAGKLQDDPTTKKINILLHPGGEEYKNTLNTRNSPSAGKYVESTYTIGQGGSGFYLHYVKAEFQLFYSNEPNRIVSRKKSTLVMARAKHAIMTWDAAAEIGHADSFGEYVYDQQVVGQWLFEGGGDGDYNWRGWMVIEFLTEQSFQ